MNLLQHSLNQLQGTSYGTFKGLLGMCSAGCRKQFFAHDIQALKDHMVYS